MKTVGWGGVDYYPLGNVILFTGNSLELKAWLISAAAHSGVYLWM